MVHGLAPSELHRRLGRGLCLQEVPREDSVLEKIGIGQWAPSTHKKHWILWTEKNHNFTLTKVNHA
jgi:hypothetical protein